jgi:acyl-CoA synthetase (NDP forming)
MVADTLAGFEDLVRLSSLFRSKPVNGLRLGAISNAGFECVTIADNLGSLILPPFRERTTNRLRSIFKNCRIDTVVDAHNPLDVTPMMNDEAFEEAVRAVMEDESVDVGVVGCVPLTGALDTLVPGDDFREDAYKQGSIGMRLARFNNESPKPWIAVIDAGRLFDPLADLLEEKGIPTFRTADEAVRALSFFCAETMRIRELRQSSIGAAARAASLAW